jgi:hypothetical protein
MYAAGGAGGVGSTGTGGLGGSGIGGSGNHVGANASLDGTPGTAHTGSGGGGGQASGGAGASGVVVISIPAADYAGNANVAGSHNYYETNGNIVIEFTGSGTYTA